MISVHETEKLTLQQIGQFLLAAKEVRFEASQREEIYGWVAVVMPAGILAAGPTGAGSAAVLQLTLQDLPLARKGEL